MSEQKKTVFLLGSKGIPANYGGFEAFIENGDSVFCSNLNAEEFVT